MQITLELSKKEVTFLKRLGKFTKQGSPAKDMFYGMEKGCPWWSLDEALEDLAKRIAVAPEL